MNKILSKIKDNINDRTTYQASAEDASSFATTFYNEILTPIRKTIKTLFSQGKYEPDDFNTAENDIVSSNDLPVVNKLSGFDVVNFRDDCYEIYEITAEFEVMPGRTLSLKATIRRSTYGEGSEVRNWELCLDGVRINSLFEETGLDEVVGDFIIRNFQGLGHYDSSIKSVTNNEYIQIAKILGIDV